MKILLVRQWKDYGGAEKYCLLLAKGITLRGDIPIVCGTSDRFINEIISRGLTAVKVPDLLFRKICQKCKNSNFFNLAVGLLGIIIGMLVVVKNRADIVHINGMFDVNFATAAKILRRKVVFTEHSDLNYWYSLNWGYQQFLRRIFVQNLDGIITVSEFNKKQLIARGISENILTRVYNGVEVNSSAMESNKLLSGKKVVVGTVSRLDTLKGIEYLLRAFKIFEFEHQNSELVIVGTGPLEDEYKQLAQELGITQKVQFCGYQKNTAEYLRGFDIFVLPSESESFSFSILEAMSSGVPIVATNVGGVSEQIESGKEGLLVPPRNPEAMSRAIKYLVDNPSLAETMRLKTLSKVKDQFSIERMISETYRVYKSLV